MRDHPAPPSYPAAAIPLERLDSPDTGRFVSAVIALLRRGVRLGDRGTRPDLLAEWQPTADKFVTLWEDMAGLRPAHALELRRRWGRIGTVAWSLVMHVKQHPVVRRDNLFNEVYCHGAHSVSGSMSSQRLASVLDGCAHSVGALYLFTEYRPLREDELRVMLLQLHMRQGHSPLTPHLRRLLAQCGSPERSRRGCRRGQWAPVPLPPGAGDAACPVCYEDQKTRPVMLGACGHFMCEACSEAWVGKCRDGRVPPTCVTCRAQWKRR